ncbi:MAG: hypothetical protein R3C02_03010 [Planctomycetaceae bacterium]
MKQNSSITLSEFRELLQLPVCVQTIWNALRDWGIVLKKVLRAAERHRPDVLQKRRWWNILMLPRPVDRLVFIDETGASTKMARLDGWGPRSERVVADIPHGHWKTTTFVGALRSTGMTAAISTASGVREASISTISVVPSATRYCLLSSFRSLVISISRRQIAGRSSALVESSNCRQQVTSERYSLGKSFQRAPARNTHRMPSRQGRGGIGGRPPADVRCGGREQVGD